MLVQHALDRQPNPVVAKVRNSGDLLCKGVMVDFFAIKFTTGDGTMMLLIATHTTSRRTRPRSSSPAGLLR